VEQTVFVFSYHKTRNLPFDTSCCFLVVLLCPYYNGSYENVVIQERAQNEKQTIKCGVYTAEESVTELGCELSRLSGPKTSSLV
jgi:hypothetical protein